MMGEKLDDSKQSVDEEEKGVDDVATGTALNDSSSGQDDGLLDTSARRVLAAQHNYKPDPFYVRVLKFVFFIPLKILSVFGISLWQNNLQISGDDTIDKSPLRPASTSPQKRKRDELGSPLDLDYEEEDDEEECVEKILDEAVEGYDSEEDKDFKPENESSSCSEEYTEGDTEAELSKLSIEDVSEPRQSALRNITEVDDKDKQEKKTKAPDLAPKPAKCIDEPISKPEMISPPTVGVVG